MFLLLGLFRSPGLSFWLQASPSTCVAANFLLCLYCFPSNPFTSLLFFMDFTTYNNLILGDSHYFLLVWFCVLYTDSAISDILSGSGPGQARKWYVNFYFAVWIWFCTVRNKLGHGCLAPCLVIHFWTQSQINLFSKQTGSSLQVCMEKESAGPKKKKEQKPYSSARGTLALWYKGLFCGSVKKRGGVWEGKRKIEGIETEVTSLSGQLWFFPGCNWDITRPWFYEEVMHWTNVSNFTGS